MRAPAHVQWLVGFAAIFLLQLHVFACLVFGVAQLEALACDLDGTEPKAPLSESKLWAPPYADGDCVPGYESWVSRDGLLPASVARQYTRSIYYAGQTLSTTGYGDIRPRSVAETLLAILCIWVAFIEQ